MDAHISSECNENGETVSTSQERLKYRYLIMLPSHERKHIIVRLLPDESICLPVLPICFHPHYSYGLPELEKVVESFFGASVRFVRELWTSTNGVKQTFWGETCSEVSVLLFEWGEQEANIDERQTMRWMCEKELSEENWVETENEVGLDMKNVVLRAMKAISGEVPLRLPAWRRMGWFSRMIGWVKEVTKCDWSDRQVYGSFMKDIDTHYSAVWRCEIDLSKVKFASGPRDEDKYVYIKACLPILREAEKVRTIAKVLHGEGIIPEIIAVNERDCMFMQRDAGYVEENDLDGERLAETVWRMQELSFERIDELKAGGIEVRDGEWLVSNICHVLHHEGLDKAVKGSEKDEKILRELRSRGKELEDAGKKICSFGFPNTLVHADLAEDNVGGRLVHGNRYYQVFDWGRCHIGHPLIDIYAVLLYTSGGDAERQQLGRKCWKQWERLINYEDFGYLLRLVDLLLLDVADTDRFLRESEFHDENWPSFQQNLRDYVRYLRKSLNDIEQMNTA